MEKKVYQSKKDYSKKYNKENISIQINRELVNKLKSNIGNLSLKSYIENIIRLEINQPS